MGTKNATLVGNVWPRACLLACLALQSACRPSETTDSCPDEVEPAFSITVRADSGPLPADTLLTLYYGGGVETYELDEPAVDHSVMFCHPEPDAHGVGGAGGAGGAGGEGGASADSTTQTLVCELWVEGAATIWVSGGDYPDLSQELQGEANECGPETVEEELVLGEFSTSSDGE